MSYETVPAQKRAAEYLERTIHGEGLLRYRIGGHSKGGNLAAYGVMMCSREVQNQVMQIWMNDSLG